MQLSVLTSCMVNSIGDCPLGSFLIYYDLQLPWKFYGRVFLLILMQLFLGRCQDSCRLFSLQLYLCDQGKQTIAINSGPLAHPEPSDSTLTVQSCHSFKRLVIAVLICCESPIYVKGKPHDPAGGGAEFKILQRPKLF